LTPDGAEASDTVQEFAAVCDMVNHPLGPLP
jgi:hypothetical protein